MTSRLQPPSKVNNPLRNGATAATSAPSATAKSKPAGMEENVPPKRNATSKAVKPAATTTAGLKRKVPPASSGSTGVAAKRAATTSATSSSRSTAGTTKQSAAFSSSSATAAASGLAKKKRPAWDTKGRLEDMEHLASQLQDKIHSSSESVLQVQQQLEKSEQRVGDLESFRQSLESSLEVKQKENSHQQEIIDRLESELKNVKLELETQLETTEKKYIQQVRDLENEQSRLKQDLESTAVALKGAHEQNNALSSAIATESANVAKLEAQLRGTKMTLETKEEDLRDRDATIDRLENELEAAKGQVDALESKLREEEQVRRFLHNTIQELKGNIRVFCRVRPPLGAELTENTAEEVMKHLSFPDEDGREIVLNQVTESASGMKSTEKNYDFQFDKVFGPSTTQAQVFEEISQLVQSACDGYNVCIFAYGQTGSGKTFTMEGPENSLEKQESMGMIPRGVLQIWQHCEKLKEKGWAYVMEGSFVEIYNETIRDLLGDGDLNRKHEIKHAAQTGKTTVTDARLETLTSPEQVVALLKKAAQNRRVAETQCNERSSRSHSVFMIRITGKNALTGEATEGVLNLIDLGIPHVSNGSTGDRLKETQAINKSLSALGDVIAALGNKDGHIPYRNSKLTYLLQNSLGGNSKTLMFVNVSPLSTSFHETLSSLRFATKVNNCQIGTARRVVK